MNHSLPTWDILIVDDSAHNLKVLSEILGANNYQARSAESGQLALDAVNDAPPDLILMDIFMPEMDGYEVCTLLKQSEVARDIPIIFMSGMDNIEEKVKAFRCGGVDFISKPFESEEVMARIETHIQIQQLHKKLEMQKHRLEKEVLDRRQIAQELYEKEKSLKESLDQLKMTHAKMIQSEKMASIGQLAAGVAHEINNPCGFVGSNLTTLMEYQDSLSRLMNRYRKLIYICDHCEKNHSCPKMNDMKADISQFETDIDIEYILDDMSSLVNESADGIDRIRKIVLELKDFAHPGRKEAMAADLNQCLETTLNIVKNEIKYKAVVHKDLNPLPLVICHPQKLNQVFMNLFVNAGQAIEESGEIGICTRDLGDCVEIKISDTGCGISPDDLSRIFDPFFTTKPVGVGTGLGLNMTYQIIQEHGGNIHVDSVPGKGTSFTLTLPVTPRPETPGSTAPNLALNP